MQERTFLENTEIFVFKELVVDIRKDVSLGYNEAKPINIAVLDREI